jgi:hypothetical protein
VSGGIGLGMDLGAAADEASIESSRARKPAAWLNALRATINAMIAMSSEKKSSGESNMRPPGVGPKLRAHHVK